MRVSVVCLLIVLIAGSSICQDQVPNVTGSNDNTYVQDNSAYNNDQAVPNVTSNVPSVTSATNNQPADNSNNNFLGVQNLVGQIQTSGNTDIQAQLSNNNNNAASNLDEAVKQVLTNNYVKGMPLYMQPKNTSTPTFATPQTQNNSDVGSGDNYNYIPEYFNLTTQVNGSLQVAKDSQVQKVKAANSVFFPAQAGTWDIYIVTNNTNGSANIALSVNQTFNYSLNGNPTTGYEWFVANPDKLAPVLKANNLNDAATSKDYTVQNQANGVIGSGKNTTFSFTAQQSGMVPIVLYYKRAWDTEVAKNYTINTYIQ